jgi:multidrug efflux pump
LTPVLNLKLSSDHKEQSWFYKVTEPFYVGLDLGYRARLQSFMKFRWLSIPIILACFGLIYYFGNTLPNELAPMEDRGEFRVSMTAPEGTSYDAMEKYVTKVTQVAMDSIKEKDVLISFTAPSFLSTSVNTGIIRIGLTEKPGRKKSQQDYVNFINKEFKKYPEARISTIQNQTISTGGTARFGLPVQFVLQNNDFEKIKEVLPKFVSEVQKSPIFQGFDSNLKFNKPELDINIDRAKASEMGVSMADVSQTLQLALSARRLGYFLLHGKQYQIIGQVDRNNRDEPTDLKKLYVKTNKGELLSLDNFVTLTEQSNPPQLFHFNRYKSATISAGLAPGKTLSDGISEMRRISKSLLDDNFRTALSGASRDFEESSGNTTFAFILALLLIFLVLAAQFESFIDPFIIMVTVPLAIAGALFSLWFLDLTINIFSQIGIIMLIGLVTKNGILIVEFANQKIDQGLSKSDAVIEAAAARLRPILMTSIATALGALPIALAIGASSTSRIALGVVIVGGILFSLLLSLFIVPAIYVYLHRTGNNSPLENA